MDITDFYDTFFEEADELLAEMETHLLDLDVDQPDQERLNAIFRAAHSIKGGAGTFGFEALQRTTHLLENLLDYARRGELQLRRDIVDTFLEAKDMLNDQLDAYRQGGEPDPEALERICETLRRLALEEIGHHAEADAPAPTPASKPAAEPEPAAAVGGGRYQVALLGVADKDRALLIEELGQLGEVESHEGDVEQYRVVMKTSLSVDDIEAVMCFIVEPEQLSIQALDTPAEPVAEAAAPQAGKAEQTEQAAQAEKAETADKPADAKPAAPAKAAGKSASKAPAGGESTSIRVPVAKVDQIINLVGELIITQSMLNQVAEDSDTGKDTGLVTGLNLLQRTARDLQEAVMSVRMVPMDYVFSRFPRLVRDLASKLGKEVELVTEGKSTELDKGLTERIIDPLTHLVRNSLDHGIETPDRREAAGKPRTGRLLLSAQHQGGNILIEVIDDGAGLNREKLLAKARSSGLSVSDSMSDDEVWQLIFAPGFSTAEEVSDVSGRGVGMDVVKRNIQSMGGHVEILSKPGQGTTTRIVLPLTLAILDGMSIRVGGETFILPVSAVIESLQPSADDLYTLAGGDTLLKVREDYLPVVAVHHALDVAEAITDPTRAIAVIVQGEGRRYAVLVDNLIGQQQVVVKNLETNYRKVPGVSAATILGDGSVALILDVSDLHRLAQSKKDNRIFGNVSHLVEEIEPS
ncbi:chemotaxis protein CheA [Alloalcanivorax gelatiniphagus]|uniref:Chemotaxis protein CheA n=1 Tax=Alloalcanivorax gelatiniphagus TaxID=1194167 RepID=A0ABY2XFR0_9GAMM|nr:chemotaxis protein CheA [Alloalcanivorax gelatiniphagus]TMW10428.1 chemotaxis protein CheA [Alloalcanivorax gelatiniphagus]